MDNDFIELLQRVGRADSATIKESAKALVNAASVWQSVNGIGPLSEQEKARLIEFIEANPALTASLFGLSKDPLH